jgi:ATP-binding cassette subfamily B multidrug efflux pump
MLKLLKYLKKSVVPIIVVIGLLVIQAMCDLSLPSYTSDIVNIGIQQGGIDTPIPEVIRKSQLDKVCLFLTEDEKEQVNKSFSSVQEAETEKYEVNEGDTVLKLTQPDELGSARDSLMKAMLSLYMMENGESQADIQISASVTEEQIVAMREQIWQQFDGMEGSILEQSAVAAVKAEYQALGIDMDDLQIQYILWSGLKMLGISLISVLAAVMVGLLASRVAASLGRDLREQVFGKVLSFSNVEFNKFSTASLITRSTNDIQQIQLLFVLVLRIVIYAPIMGVGGVIKVLNTNTSMTWIIGLSVLLIMLVVAFLFGVVMPRFKLMQKLIDRLNLVTREILTGLSVIRAFSREKYEEKRFDKANIDLTKTNLFVNRVMSCMMPLMMLIMNLTTVLIVWAGGHGVDSGNMQVGDMMAFIQYTMQIIMAFLMISMVSIMLPRASVSALRIDEVLTTDVSIKDEEKTEVFSDRNKGIVEFKNVSFSYPGADEEVLTDISFTARPGETTAVIGSTGSGKSTLVNLIPRFYDVTSGEIRVDGINIKKVSMHDLRDKLGYVPQKGVLFSGTIESNIKFSDESLDDEQMKKAAEIAQALEFIEEKPKRFQSDISQGGSNVSGGQKQRLSIARAIAKSPEIYIFDDSFSALDYKTDVTLRRALKKETAESTVIIVAQRISTILNADQILVLDEGRLAGIGTHKELLKNCEVYRQIAYSQLSKEELDNE